MAELKLCYARGIQDSIIGLYHSVAPHVSIAWEDLTITLRIPRSSYIRKIRNKNIRESRP